MKEDFMIDDRRIFKGPETLEKDVEANNTCNNECDCCTGVTTEECSECADGCGMTPETEKVDPNTGKVEPDPDPEPKKVPEGTASMEFEDKPTLIGQILANDILTPFIASGLIPTKYIISLEGKIVQHPWRAPKHDAPWTYVRSDNSRNCVWHRDIGTIFNFIPRSCMNCWKVVVIPQTLEQLIRLFNLEKRMSKQNPYVFCKCGIEERPECTRNYGGYFYCGSKEQGLDRLDQVRANVEKHVGKDIPVFLKRSCTEFEAAFGPSDGWDDIKDQQGFWDHIEDEIGRNSYIARESSHQPAIIENHVIAKWVRHAASVADPTVEKLNGGKPIFRPYVKYEREK